MEQSPLIELEAPVSHSQMSVMCDSLERRRVATPAVSWVLSALLVSVVFVLVASAVLAFASLLPFPFRYLP